MILVYHKLALVLFDPESTYSYISSYYALWLDLISDLLSVPWRISTPLGDSLVMDRVFISCVVIVSDVDTYADLIILDMLNFDVVLGIDWLAHYHTVMDCFAKTITLAMPGIPPVMW